MAGAERKVLIEENRILGRVRELVMQVARDYKERDLLLVGVLRGATVFAVDIQRELYRLGKDCEIDYMGVSSYQHGTESSRNPKIVKDLDTDICGRYVLLIDDILDTGWELG